LIDDPPQRLRITAEMRLMLDRSRQAWRLIARRSKWALGGAVLVMAVTSACNTGLALLLGRLVDGVQQGIQQGRARDVLLGFAALELGLISAFYLTRELLNVVRRSLVAQVCSHVNRDVSLRLIGHLLTVPLATLSREKLGALHGRIFRSVGGLVQFLQLNFLDFFPAVLTGGFALAAAMSKQPLLGAVMTGVIPLSFFLTARQIVSEKGIRLRLMRSVEEIDGTVVEQLSGIEYLRAANTHRQEMQRLADATERRRAMEVRHNVRMALFGSAKAINEGLFHVLVLAAAIYLAIHGRITTGDVLMFSILYLNVMAPLSELHRVLDEGHESSLRVGELLEMLAEPVDPSFNTPAACAPALVCRAPAIVVDHLQVGYSTPLEQRRWALEDVSLTIQHGETVGIAGRTGSGKSTFIKVLLRMIHPSGGTVLIGNVPLTSLSRAHIGQFFGYVGQSPFAFTGTIAENIAYGNESASPADIQRAAEMAHLHDEIMQMPGHYQALVSERGQSLSGGQRQCLALARVLLKQPPILVLDEATSALDNISERHVQQELGLSCEERTTILVAHRLTTLRDADRIFVFDKGRIAEVGPYDHLVAAGGVFAELVASAEHGITSNGHA